MSRRYPLDKIKKKIPELNSEKFIMENHEFDNSLNFLFYCRDPEENLRKLDYEIVGFCDEPHYCRMETFGKEKEIMPGIMICDLRNGEEFWSHLSVMGMEIFLFKDEDKKLSLETNAPESFKQNFKILLLKRKG